jgi:hypothetical protein
LSDSKNVVACNYQAVCDAGDERGEEESLERAADSLDER